MSQTFFILAFALAITTSAAQVVKCKLAVNTVDSFTGSRIVETKPIEVGKTEGTRNAVFLSVRKVDSTYFITVASQMQKCVGSTNSAVYFKNNIGDIYQLKHMGEVNCGERVYLGSGVYMYLSSSVRVQLDPETDKIRKQPITMMRISIDQTYVNIIMTMPMILKQIFDCVDNAPDPKR